MRRIDRAVRASRPTAGREGGVGIGLWRRPDPPKDRPLVDARRGPPARKRGHRAEFGLAVGEGDEHGVGLRPLAALERQLMIAIRAHEIAKRDPGQLRSPERPCNPTSSKARSRSPRMSSGMGDRNSRSTASVAARFLRGLGASRRMPGMVSDTGPCRWGRGDRPPGEGSGSAPRAA